MTHTTNQDGTTTHPSNGTPTFSEPGTVGHLTPAQFEALNRDDVTLVDLREPDEQVVFPVPGSISAPFSGFPQNLERIPRDRPIVVFCRVGDWSEQVAEILADEGARVSTLDGGVKAYRAYLAERDGAPAHAAASAPGRTKSPSDDAAHESLPADEATSTKAAPAPGKPLAQDGAAPHVVHVDARGLKCPGPIVAVGDAARAAHPGDVIEVEATEDAFCSDIAVWCERTGNPLERLETSADGIIHVRIRRGDGSGLPVLQNAGAGSAAAHASGDTPAQAGTAPLPADVQTGHDKTFVVFSGDLDKTIAAFIIANGAAAMGRKVTMFFTFWGLNILRRPSRVQVAKGALERMFCAMMPRGTLKLGLSRMNMLGIGPKMIRFMMRKKGIASLEELIAQAQAHGVRIVACQMSMDIMGISKEELLDGVELGGVATFLGSGETSDMSLFI